MRKIDAFIELKESGRPKASRPEVLPPYPRAESTNPTISPLIEFQKTPFTALTNHFSPLFFDLSSIFFRDLSYSFSRN
jgi:hypothetical protein